ncbi:CPBP family glutamic-type intramembrane protease [Luteipulveratus sp. YIM 133132]|uniref:CPBP family intramembrane glutamic endopeptidase n=1 Tax=Luteipulveratus flavus TaxID=3031728 RepID=UPI0023B01796|nr:CPBP family intramembrane glutamic endopeptidase [Luteipulveratus sp. YIM 133132]MDE9366152.1 CPBP family glutamic-type intramembrane protease [Luteipulveratus sp. YIM 133132]
MPSSEVIVRRRFVCVVATLVGTALLALALSTPPGSPRFYPLGLAVALTWLVGALLAAPVRLAGPRAGAPTPPVVAGLLTGLALSAACALGVLVLARVGAVHEEVSSVIDLARRGRLALVLPLAVLTGTAEELFFRGAVYEALPRGREVVLSTVLYALVTMATGNPMLVAATVVLGLVTARQRAVTGGVLAPVITHAVWTVCLVLVLPAVLDATA